MQKLAREMLHRQTVNKMAETWYHVQPSWKMQRIVPVEVDRHTEHSVYLTSNPKYRVQRYGWYDSYYPTRDRAFGHLREQAERSVENTRGHFERAQEQLAEIMKLRDHDEVGALAPLNKAAP